MLTRLLIPLAYIVALAAIWIGTVRLGLYLNP